MSKAPAFQFYVKDWLADVELQAASASTRGIWINALCLMWESRTRGTISGATPVMARRLNCTAEEFDLFLAEAKALKFADVTFCNGEVTLTNRRMRNEEKVREGTRLRVQRHRGNASCNAEVTPPSSSSSSSPSTEVLSKDPPSDEGGLSASPPSGGTADAPAQLEPETGHDTAREDSDPKRVRGDDCPHRKIIELYHETLPELPRVESWGEDNQAQLKARWREDRTRQSLEWWDAFFRRVKASDFLCGRVSGREGRAFFANLSWLVKKSNLGKLLNGQYDNRGPRTGSALGNRNAMAAQMAIANRRQHAGS